MKVFAISDLHLSLNNPKPMDIFGPTWEGYIDKIFSDWRAKVTDEDIVLLAGDFSWAMRIEESVADFRLLENLPGKKVIIRGNHDYWWKSISAVRAILPENFYAVQNDAVKFGNVIICGTRGWSVPERGATQSEEDEKIFKREVIRLELTLQAAEKIRAEGDSVVCMIHYPPMNFSRDDSPMTELIEKYKVSAAVFGHLHGMKNPRTCFEKNGVRYYLTSCDAVGNKLTEICCNPPHEN